MLPTIAIETGRWLKGPNIPMSKPQFPVCPLPVSIPDRIQMAHGSGGRAMHTLIDQVFRKAFDNPWLQQHHDGAAFELTGKSAMSTDSYVVSPLFFPGGDIGSMAINGTVNDLLMCGAIPRYLSTGFILEEGLDMTVLVRIVESMASTAKDSNVQLVTGDIKVVDRQKADGLYINTAGVGEIITRTPVRPESIRRGDMIILSGDIGRHGIAVMSERENLGLKSGLKSDCASLLSPIHALIMEGIDIHCLRDLTRGGLATALVELAEYTRFDLEIHEQKIPVLPDVNAVCELLGLDPLYVANEGRFIMVIPECDCVRAMDILRNHEVTTDSQLIGRFLDSGRGQVLLRGNLGVSRPLDMLTGEQLPRIC